MVVIGTTNHPTSSTTPCSVPAVRNAAARSPSGQARFDAFINGSNCERPHEALGIKAFADIWRPPEPYGGRPEVEYPFHDRDVLVANCGRICMHRKKINISVVMAGQRLGIKEVDDGIGPVSSCSMMWDISTWSKGLCKSSTTRSARGCYPCLRDNMVLMRQGWTLRQWCRLQDSNLRPHHYE